MSSFRKGKKSKRVSLEHFAPLSIQVSDIILLVANILSGSELSEEQLIVADVVSDGTIDILVRCLESDGGRIHGCSFCFFFLGGGRGCFFLKNEISACGNHLCRMPSRLWI